MVTKKGDDYIWETREKKPLVKTRSGVYTWFLSPTGTGYIKVASREAPGILIEPLTYMEHLTIGFLTITYWGKLEDFQDEPEEYDLAIESFQKAISIDPESALFHYNLGRVYSLQDKKALSIGFLRKAISFGKNYIDFDGMAEKNSDFDNIRESPEFQALIGSFRR